MARLWARMIEKHRIVRSEMVDLDNMMDALHELCVKMDIPRPLFLSKHQREWDQFQQTSFLKDHFVEAVTFDKLEIERVDTDAPQKKSKDPRNG